MKIITAYNLFVDFIASYSGCKFADFLSPQQTVDIALEERKSIIRYGDGEFNYLTGKSIHYQSQNSRLKEYLSDILEAYKNNADCNYVVCMPSAFLKCKGIKLLKKKSYFVSWPFSRRFFIEHYDNMVSYGDAFLFAEENQYIYNRLWKESKANHLILVHNDRKYLSQLEKESNKKCTFIQIPDKDAFSEFNRILTDVEHEVLRFGKEKCMVIICAGPCAKALVYELSKIEVWAIDAGHCFCKPLHTMK